jgi:hypothetical protein
VGRGKRRRGNVAVRALCGERLEPAAPTRYASDAFASLRGLRYVPPLVAAEELAMALRAIVGLGAARFDLACLDDEGFTIGEAKLRPGGGGKEAMMFVGGDGRFHIAVDTTPPSGWSAMPDELRREVARHRYRFRVAHEIGHSFFYRASDDGKYVRTRRSTDAEERFCDHFAGCLLIPTEAVRMRAPSARTVVELHHDFDVSLQAAARALLVNDPQAAIVVLYCDDTSLQVQWHSPAARRMTTEISALTLSAVQALARRRGWSTAAPPPPRQQLVLVA